MKITILVFHKDCSLLLVGINFHPLKKDTNSLKLFILKKSKKLCQYLQN